MRATVEISDADAKLLREWIRSELYEERYAEGYGWSCHARHPVTSEQISRSYQSWAIPRRAWHVAQQGGTGVLAMIVWYQHVHKPGSREWRPAVIIRAALSEAQRATMRA